MEQREQAYKDYKSGLKVQQIADKYGISVNTVKSWRSRSGWAKRVKEETKGAPHNSKNAPAPQKGAPQIKKNAPRKKKVDGRPTVFTEEVIRKLEFAFSKDFNDREAAHYAGIHPSTLSVKFSNDPDFLNRMAVFKDKTRQAAKMVIVDALEQGDAKTAQWYAEHRLKDEYSNKTEQVVTATVDADVNAVVANPFEAMTKAELRKMLRG